VKNIIFQHKISEGGFKKPQGVLDLGVNNLGGGMTVCRVKFGSKEVILKIGRNLR